MKKLQKIYFLQKKDNTFAIHVMLQLQNTENSKNKMKQKVSEVQNQLNKLLHHKLKVHLR